MQLKILEKLDWNSVDEMNIDRFNWDYAFKPLSKAKLCFVKGQGLCIKMWSYEDHPVSVHTQKNSFVHKDSCLEFFFNVYPDESKEYINFEVNHLGVMFVQHGEGRHGRSFISEVESPEVSTFSGTDSIGEFWGIEYVVSPDFISAVYGKSDFEPGKTIKANFYKCGDETGRTHYGSWTEIGTEYPDFHRPEFFGELTIKSIGE